MYQELNSSELKDLNLFFQPVYISLDALELWAASSNAAKHLAALSQHITNKSLIHAIKLTTKRQTK
jgi:hypothetical protein